ncbi:MAG TPA: hypothetical protein VFS21_10115 [Roseiflexaceae bacterium]|nr:hypothetical protein [Roseiflexaceae bacterium]
MRMPSRADRVVAPDDPLRWVTFSGFWGFVFFVLSVAGMLAGQRHTVVRINQRTLWAALLLHMAAFVGGGTLFSALQQLLVRRSAKEQAEQAVATGALQRSIPLQALGSALGAVVPFGLAVGSARLAEHLTGAPLLPRARTDWPRALAVTSGLSGLVALAVTRIAAWVAEDALRAKTKG